MAERERLLREESKMIEINCNKCRNCTGNSCKKYGANAKESVTRCANDGFRHYKQKKSISRATLRGKPLDDDCKSAKISKHEFGLDDNRLYCYGLFAPNSTYEIHQKCIECGAYCMNAKPK